MLTKLLEIEHKKYPSHGYHRLAGDVFAETEWVFSHNLAHKRGKVTRIIPLFEHLKLLVGKKEEQIPR